MFNSSFSKLSLTQPAFYLPQPQHTLVDVISHSYGILPGQEPIFSTLLCMNPEVVKARMRQVVNGGSEFALVDTARNFVPTDPAERGMYEFLARISNDSQHVTDFAGLGLGVLGYLSGVQNRAVGVNPSPVFVKHAERMAKLSRFAAGGGLLLTAFGAMGACGKVASTGSVREKNEVFAVEATGLIAGASGGLAASMAIGALFVSGPVGWVVALLASAVGGYFAQEAGKSFGKAMYDQYGNRIDLLDVTGVGQLCR